MKQKFKWLLALVAMVASMNLMAETYTISFVKGTSKTGTDISTSLPTNASTMCQSGSDYIASFNGTNAYYNASGCGIRLAKSGSAGSLTITLSNDVKSNVKEVIIYASAVASGNTLDVTPAGTVTTKTTFNSLSTYSTSAAISTYAQSAISINGTLTSLTFGATSKKYVHLHQIDIITNEGGPTLESIYFTNDAATKLSYTEGDVFDPVGLVVMGNYSEGDDKDVTDDVEWSFSPETLATTTTSVTVTASIDGVDDAQKVVNGLTVAAAPKYTKVTANKTDWSGEYLLVYEGTGDDAGKAFVWTGVDASYENVSTTISNNQIAKPAKAATLTVAAITDGYSIQVNGGTNDGKYIGKDATGNGMDIGASAYKNTISFSNSSAVIAGAGNSTMRYNTASDQKRFRYYGSGQQAVQLYEKVLDPISSAVTFTAPTDGSLVIKNGGTPITSGTTIQDETVLDVTFGMTPAEAYKDVAIKVTNTTTSADVTEKVYDATKKQITMPRYAITVAVTFTKLYKISLVTDGEGTGTATMNGVTTDIYVDGETQIDLVASAVAPNEFTKWSATDNIAINEENEAETYAYASGDGTITATFGISELQPLDAPTLSDPTNVTYSGVTLNWQELANAEGYNVEILLNDETVASNVIIGETSWTPEVTLQANTTYTYTVQGVGDGTTYAEENNPKAQSTVKTADYPAVVLTLSENGNTTPVNGKLNTPIELPATSTQACDGKVFMGWSENPIEGEVGKDQVSLLDATYTFTDPNTLSATIYAVYAKAISGESQKYTLDYTTDVSSKTLGYGSAVDVTASDGSKWVVKASKQQGMQINTGKNASIKIPTCPRNITSIEVVGTAEKAVGLSAEDYSGSGTITYIAFGTDAKEQTIDLTNKSVTSGYIVGKSGANPITKIVVNYEGESTYSNYCTTCQAAVAVPTFSLDEGEYNEAQTLTLTATEGDIYYTINDGEETKYTAAIALNNRGTYEISAYAKVDDRTSETITKTYTLDWAYTLAELVDEGAPTTAGRNVTVILTNEIIESLATSGSYVNGFFTMVGDKKIEVYCKNSPATWEVGGKVSGTVTCPWKLFSSTWELCPTDWEWASYTTPAKITSLKITGDVTNKNYTAGQKLDFTGLTVWGVYNDNTELTPHKEDVTADVVWTEVTLTENQPEAIAKATLNNAKTGNVAVSESKTITGLTVGAKVELSKIEITTEASKKDFFVGRNFNHDGIVVTATYSNGSTSNVTNACDFSTPTLANKGQETVTITYSEGEGQDKKEVTTSYTINVKYMNLSDLVAEDLPEAGTSVKVAFSDVEITGFYTNKSSQRTGVYVNVKGKNEKNIELYYNTPSTDLDAWQEGGLLATKNAYISGTWSYYENGEVWEITFASGWDWDTNLDYTAPNIPVTSMEISPAEVSVGEAKTATLSIVYTPEHATNKGVTWAVTAGNDYVSVDPETGVVTGNKAGSATITATLTADPTITATRTVTVTETPKCTISYYVKDEVASTQEIAREEEGTLTYEPTLVVAGYTFAGWAEATIAEETATATLISTYTPAAAEATKSVYAVFKRVDDSSPTYQQYAKVTSALTDWSGDYLLVYENEGTAYVWTGVDAASCNVTATIDGNVISSKPDGAVSLTIAAMTDGYSIQVKGGTNDGKYIGKNASGNGMDIGASAYKNTISISENNAVITGAGGSTMRYNTANDQKRFRYYGSGQQAVQLYKYDAGTALYTSNPVAKVKVTFNLDGGVGGCGTITVNEGEDVTLCDAAPTKDLYKFDAWSDGVNEYAPSATIENVTEDIELKALWIAKKQYTITFNKAGAAGTTPDDITDYEYNVVTLPAQGDLSNPGYIFGGWNDGETTHAGGATFTMPENNVSMTAVWVAKTNDKWVLVTEASQLKAGEKYVIANNENDAVAGDIIGSNAYMNKVSATFSDNKQFITAMAGQVELTLGGSPDAWTFAKDASNYLANSGTNLSWSETASTWKIAFEDDKMTIVEGENNSLQYNTGSPRFKTYTSSQAAVQFYRLIPDQKVNGDVDASDLPEQANVTVNEGGNLLVTEGDIELGDIYVMEGGKVTIQGTATLTVNNFVIKSSMGGGKSGQVIGVTTENFTITDNAYYDVVLGDNANPEKWHAFAVPFNVDAINGIYDLDDNKLTNEVNYAIMDYHGDVRADGQYGWKKFRGIMNPGVFYLMTVDGERTTYRMKMNGGFQASSSTITVNQYASGTDADAGWNGIANNQLNYSSIDVDVQVLNPTSYTFETMTASTYNFTVGTPFFYQASATGTIDLTAPNAGAYYAPRMTAEAKNIAVTLGNDNYTDRLYISATDEATNEYQIGRDLAKMTMTNAPAVPQIFAEAYGTKLSMIDVPMMYDEAVYALNLYAPANGEYTMGAAQVEGYEVFLTQNGNVIWNLSMSEATVELTKGNNTEYGLILKATSGHAPTDINTLNGQESVQKFLYNSNIYIRHNNKTFNVQGQLVK